MRWVHSHSQVWIKISGIESTIWATALHRGEFYWRDIWKDGGWMKVWSKSLERIKNCLQQWNTSQRMQVVWKFFLQLLERPPLNTWSPEVKYIAKSSILRWNYFFQYEGQGPPARGVESIWSAIKCQKRPICWYILQYNWVTSGMSLLQMLRRSSKCSLLADCWKKNIVCIKIFIRYDIITYH